MSAPIPPAGGSLADRITKPDSTPTTSILNASASDFRPSSGKSWADEVNSPSNEEPPIIPNIDTAKETSTTTSETKETNIAQMDGATEPFNGSQLHEPDYAVDIKLADMQADPNNPLYSVKSFEELGLCVIPLSHASQN